MREKMKEVRGDFHIAFMGAVLLGVVIIFSLLVSSYFKKFDATLMAENRQHLAEIADHIAAYIQSTVKSTQTLLQADAEGAGVISGPNQRMEYLKGIQKKQGLAYMGWAGRDGILHATVDTESVDISGEDYFIASMNGQPAITGLTRRIFKDKAVTGILMSVPMYGKDNRVSGVLVAMLDIGKLQKALQVESFGGEGYSYIIDGQGNLVLRTKSMDYNNFFRVLQNVKFSRGFSLEQIKGDIIKGKPGLALYDNLGTEQYAYYRPLGLNSWTIVNIVAKDVITGKTAVLTKELAFLSIFAVLVFLVLLVAAAAAFEISESSRKAAAAKTAFLANMSHEIRTPMNAIVGISEILLRGGLTAQQRDYVLSIVNSGKSLLAIINDILDLSKIEAGKFTIVSEDYEVESLLYDVISIIAVRIGEKPVSFLMEVDTDLPGHLVGDVTRVKQILINILGNAVKFTEKGHIKLTIKSSIENGEALLTMIVEDTGIGIRKQDMGRLFVSFNQVDSHHSHSVEGTGLGLAISKKLSEMMGGDIQVESEYAKGSVFTITIRQLCQDCHPIIQTVWPEGCKVLLLENSDLIREYYDGCMTKMNLPHKTCGAREEFESSLADGSYRYVLANRLEIRRLTVRELSPQAHLVTLLSLEEHPLMAVNTTDMTVYSPLFSIQLSAVIRRGAERGYVPRRTGIDLASIRPMPYVRVLIVDDNEVNLQVASGLMNPYHMQIDCVLSGREAVKAVQEKDYDLVLMDHMMPEMDGVETLKAIRSLPGDRYQKLPVVALTANATHDARSMFLAEGFDGFLAKPIETSKLNETLKKWLKAVNDQRAVLSDQKPQEAEVRTQEWREEQRFLQTFQAAREINFSAGTAQLNGLEPYVKVLNTYIRTTSRRLPELKALLREDFDRFVVEVHGLKGASASIAAGGVSELAQELELCGRAQNIQGIEAALPVFLERAEKSLKEAKEFIEAYQDEHRLLSGEGQNKRREGSLSGSLSRLEQAFADFDTEQLKELFEELGHSDYGEAADRLLESLKRLYEEYEFEKPLELIAAYRQEHPEEKRAV